MMCRDVRSFVLVAVTLLAACSEAPPASEPTEPAEPVQSQPAEFSPRAQIITEDNQGVLSDAQRDGLNAANQASAILEQADAERRRQLDAQTR